MEWTNNWGYGRRRSSGVAKAGLATGIVGTSLAGLGWLGSGLGLAGRAFDNSACYGGVPQTVVINANDDFNRNGRNSDNACCSENVLVNRYELQLQQQIAEKDSQIALRDANTYNDQKMLEMYKYIDGRFQEFERELGRQAVINQKTEDSFALAKQEIDCNYRTLSDKICDERRERRCADNTIITYTNATFYPKQTANVTVGAETTPQSTYNPLPQDGCCCG